MIKTGTFLILALAFSQVLAVPVDQFIAEHPSGFLIPARGPASCPGGWRSRDQHPHQVFLRLVRPTGTVENCGGSVVHREWIVSAAHCTAGVINVMVRAGVTDLSRPEVTQETSEVYNYPTFDISRPRDVQPDDVSLIKLRQPLTYTSNLRPIRIQPSWDAYRDYSGAVLYASGFGRTWTEGATSDSLLWVFLRGVTNQYCTQLFGSGIVTGNSICANFYNVTSQSICQGDSGGPLVDVDADGTPTLVGISSFVASGQYGCHSGIPGGFTRPGPFHSWFTQITGIDFNNLVEEEDELPTTAAAPETTDALTVNEPDATETLPPSTTAAPQTTLELTTYTPETNVTLPTTPEEVEESEEIDDPEVADLLKRLEVKVKVKVRLNKYVVKKKTN